MPERGTATCGDCLSDLWDDDEWLLLPGQRCSVCDKYRPEGDLLQFLNY